MHANLMFGGVIFGKASYGLARRAEIFISYHWGQQSEYGFETQMFVATLKNELERHTRLTCWFDLDRMGAGEDILDAMRDGVAHADVFVCCLTDSYVHSVNCMREFKHAVNMRKLIIPLLLPGYGDPDGATTFPPIDPNGIVQKALSETNLYVDLRTPERMHANFPGLVNRVDSHLRFVRRRRAERRLQKGAGKVVAANRLGMPDS